MELKINAITPPEAITFNYEELKVELTERVSVYEMMVYTEDQVKAAKADRANLNRLKKALNDERIAQEKRYMEPFNDYKRKTSELIGIIDKGVANIDGQCKAFEESRRQQRLDEITEFWNECENPHGIHLSQVLDEKWLNASTAPGTVQNAIVAILAKIDSDIKTLRELPQFAFEAVEMYLYTLDMAKAVNEANRLVEMAKRKAEAASAAIKPTPGTVPASADTEESRNWVSFAAYITPEDAMELRKFFVTRGIEYKAI